MSMFLQQWPWKKKKWKLPVSCSTNKIPCRTLMDMRTCDTKPVYYVPMEWTLPTNVARHCWAKKERTAHDMIRGRLLTRTKGIGGTHNSLDGCCWAV
eukprot:3724487-Ditylum_brightwellii.AAC.1